MVKRNKSIEKGNLDNQSKSQKQTLHTLVLPINMIKYMLSLENSLTVLESCHHNQQAHAFHLPILGRSILGAPLPSALFVFGFHGAAQQLQGISTGTSHHLGMGNGEFRSDINGSIEMEVQETIVNKSRKLWLGSTCSCTYKAIS